MIRRINAGNRIHFIPGIGIQVITPRGGAKWWLAGGISAADCVGAYQAKGAASYAASLVNLNGPGTYNLTQVNAPTWDASYGWYFDGVAGALYIPYVPFYPEDYSLIIRFSNATIAKISVIGGQTIGIRKRFELWNQSSALTALYAIGNNANWGAAAYSSGVIAIANQSGYYNGIKDCDIPVTVRELTESGKIGIGVRYSRQYWDTRRSTWPGQNRRRGRY